MAYVVVLRKGFNENCVWTCLHVQCLPQECGRLCGYTAMFANLGEEIAFSCSWLINVLTFTRRGCQQYCTVLKRNCWRILRAPNFFPFDQKLPKLRYIILPQSEKLFDQFIRCG